MTRDSDAFESGEKLRVEQAEGEPGRLVVYFGDQSLPMSTVEGQKPRVRDLDLGKLLGFDRPRAIRDLIKRMIRARKLKDIHQCRTVERREGQVAPQVVTEFWLTREQALLVATQSDTPRGSSPWSPAR